jgi:hypothetical protein
LVLCAGNLCFGILFCSYSCCLRVLRAVALSYVFFCCFYVYLMLPTTVSVVCNLRYEGSLIADL